MKAADLKDILQKHTDWLKNQDGGARADLTRADLTRADLTDADLTHAKLSGSKGLTTSQLFLSTFESDQMGVIVYKAIGGTDFDPPEDWKIEPGSVIAEVVNPCRTVTCGCGVNFGTLDYVRKIYPGSVIWRCRIAWLDLADVVVPYNTDGKARCARLQLLEKIPN